MITSRRSFFLGATAFLAAPSIVRAASLMLVSVVDPLALAHARAAAAERRIQDWLDGREKAHGIGIRPVYSTDWFRYDGITWRRLTHEEVRRMVREPITHPVTVTADASRHTPRYRHEAA